MLKRAITFTDYNGNTHTEDFYFNLSKVELIELETQAEGGSLQKILQSIMEAEDVGSVIKHFKQIILLAYGEKDPSGKRFVKNDDIREAFSQSPAFEALFMELATNHESAVAFTKGIVPADLAEEPIDQDKPVLPPKPSRSE